jgi:DNA uptake protein ComE-like DNA-binding protein
MKTKLHFTRGEWAAALFLLTIMIASNIYYFWHDNRQKPSCDFSPYEAQFQQFAQEQQRQADSIEATWQQTFGDQPRVRSDTLPPLRKQERKPMYDIVKVDLNSCDTNDLLTIPQFGSKRAARLVEYREKLGGFYCYAQLLEVYIMQNIDTVKLKTYLYINKQKIKKLNINTATYQELVSHPYIDAYLTKLILRHRERYGPIHDLNELQQITHAYPELIEKLRPYLLFN